MYYKVRAALTISSLLNCFGAEGNFFSKLSLKSKYLDVC